MLRLSLRQEFPAYTSATDGIEWGHVQSRSSHGDVRKHEPGAGSLDASEPELELHDAQLAANGKRGNVTLEYRLLSDHKPVGQVAKRLVLGGLRPYCPDAMAGVLEEFYRLKARGVDYGSNL
nr:DUF3581 family protein [Marinobacter similis]